MEAGEAVREPRLAWLQTKPYAAMTAEAHASPYCLRMQYSRKGSGGARVAGGVHTHKAVVGWVERMLVRRGCWAVDGQQGTCGEQTMAFHHTDEE